MLDPEAAPLLELDRQLAELQRRCRTARHIVAARRERPDGIDDDTYEWWIAAHNAALRQRFELGAQLQTTPTVEQIELRKDRLRRPSR